MAARENPNRLIGIDRDLADRLERLIMDRRSIRAYASEPVPEACIEAVLRCGAQAPSPSNRQPVRFARIASPELRDRLHQALLNGHARLLARSRELGGGAKMRNRINVYRRHAEFMAHAPMLFAVGVSAATLTGFSGHLAEAGVLESDPRRGADGDIAVGLALKGMLLKAWALGLGSCILTSPLVFIEDVDRLLGLADIQVKCFLTLGFAAQTERPLPVPRLPLEAVCRVL